jgi:hypothetical protein
MITVVAPEGVFAPEAESTLLTRMHAALAAAVDATDDPQISAIIGATLHIVPKHRYTMGGMPAAGVLVEVAVPAVALSSFRRRRRFVRDATQAIADTAIDASIADRVMVSIQHLVDGGWGLGGVARTNDELDEGPETT